VLHDDTATTSLHVSPPHLSPSVRIREIRTENSLGFRETMQNEREIAGNGELLLLMKKEVAAEFGVAGGHGGGGAKNYYYYY
jgi:hypothetical protein